MKKLLLIDNYDSFTYNLKHCLQIAGANVQVVFSDDPQLRVIAQEAQAIIISPGPSKPSKSFEVKSLIKSLYTNRPVLGICLGMQIINENFGGTTGKAPFPVHGKIAEISILRESRLFNGLPDSFKSARYHSLVCKSISREFVLTASYNTVPMAIEHRSLPVYGVQFHPESFLSKYGQRILTNFVNLV